MEKSHEIAIQKVLDYAKQHISEPVSLESFMRHVGYSSSWLRSIFKKGTGKSIMAYQGELRLQKAKELLTQTHLTITEIAFEAGFESAEGFATFFRKKTGQSPSGFRAASPLREINDGHRNWFADSFDSGSLEKWWKPLAGDWVQENGTVCGKNAELVTLCLGKSLPENFRLSLEFRFEDPGTIPIHLLVALRDKENAGEYFTFVLSEQTGVLEIRRHGITTQWVSLKSEKRNQWNKLSIELKDDHIRFYLNDEETFVFQDAFPPPYALRCNFSMGSWGGKILFRGLVIQDAGFLPFARTVRQGDALFNAEFFDQAQQTYTRQLESGLSQADSAELNYKIGMCLLRQNQLPQARNSMNQVRVAPENRFWNFRTELAYLEMFLMEEKVNGFFEKAGFLFKNRSMQSEIRNMIQSKNSRYENAGFFSPGYHFYQFLVENEEPQSYAMVQAKVAMANALQNLNQFGRASEVLLPLTDQSIAAILQIQILHQLGTMLAFQGNTVESNQVISKIRERTSNPSDLVLCQIYEARNFRGQGDMQKAVSILENVPRKFEKVKNVCAVSQLMLSGLWCGLEKPDLARKALKHAQEIYPSHPLLQKGTISRYEYPIFLMEKEFEKAKEILLEDSAVSSGTIAKQAEHAVKAGILLELNQENNEAHKVWQSVIRRFPQGRCNFFAALSQKLVSTEEFKFEEMPYPAQVRSEMFYLAGLLWESRKNAVLALSFFQASLQEDPTLFWPAFLSGKRVMEKAKT